MKLHRLYLTESPRRINIDKQKLINSWEKHRIHAMVARELGIGVDSVKRRIKKLRKAGEPLSPGLTGSERAKKRWADNPELRKIQSERIKKLWDDPEHREMHSKKAKKQWDDPEFREKMSQASSERTRKLWDDPEYRERMSQASSERMQERWKDPEYKETMSQLSKERWEDPEFREMMSQKMKERWEDPEFREMMIYQITERWKNNPEYREMMMSLPHITDFNAWLNKFPEEKQRLIIKALFKNKSLRE